MFLFLLRFLPNKTANTPVEPANIEVNNPTFVISPVFTGFFCPLGFVGVVGLLGFCGCCGLTGLFVTFSFTVTVIVFSVIAPFLSTTRKVT